MYLKLRHCINKSTVVYLKKNIYIYIYLRNIKHLQVGNVLLKSCFGPSND